MGPTALEGHTPRRSLPRRLTCDSEPLRLLPAVSLSHLLWGS